MKAVKINNSNISEDLKYHIKNDIGVDKNIFRPGSSSYFSVINEARILYKKGIYSPKNQEELSCIIELCNDNNTSNSETNSNWNHHVLS